MSATTDVGSEPVDYTLPLTPYYYTNTELLPVDEASTLLVGRCMKQFGYTQDVQVVIAVAEARVRAEVMDFGPIGNARRYGSTEVSSAQRYGYHLRAEVDGVTAEVDAAGDSRGLGEMSSEMETLLTGMSAPESAAESPHRVTQLADGTAIPDGGCLGEAERQLGPKATGTVGQTADLVSSLKADSYARAGRDPDVLAAESRWRDCMHEQGYARAKAVMTAPEDLLGDDIESPQPSSRELRIAAADARCNLSSGFTETYYQAETRIQKGQVEQHAEELAAVQKEKNDIVKAAAAVLASIP